MTTKREQKMQDDNDESLDAYDPYYAEIARIPAVKIWHTWVYGGGRNPLLDVNSAPIDVIGEHLARVANKALSHGR